MATVHVRRLDDQVVEGLKARATANTRSLEGEVRHILEQASKDDMAEKKRAFLEKSRKWLDETAGIPQTPSEILIRRDRDSGHRDGSCAL